MAHCVNKNSPEFKALLEQTKANPISLAADVSLWQERNGLDNFPSAQDILSPKETPSQSVASPKTIEKVKKVMQDIGVSFQYLHDYAKANPGIQTKDANGLADLTQGVIAVSQGTENATLTEEMVHIATAILEQTNPSLITKLISQIDKFKIYKITYDAYKNNKAYQLPNGKPDIRKIKKEAVDKLIAEYIIRQDDEFNTDFPELMQPEVQYRVEEWWDTILEVIRNLYGRTKTNLFAETAEHIMTGDIGKIEDAKAQGIHYQLNENVVGNNSLVDKIVDHINNIDSRMELLDADPEDRHYKLDGTRVANSVTQKIEKTKKPMPPRTDAQKIIDNQKRDWGSEGHRYIQKWIEENLIDKLTGFKKPATDNPIDTTLDEDATEVLQKFCKELIDSYPDGTRFLLEKMAVNQREKGMLGSTIDFIAVSPVKKEDGSEDVAIDILDWKFTDIDKSREEDVPWYKQRDWKPQMGEYTKIMYEYGVKPHQIKKARMVPLIMNYVDVVEGDELSGKMPSSIEVGNVDSLKETKLYLLPVPINTESTGNEAVDDLLKSLRGHWEKIYSRPVAPEKKHLKNIQINELSKAIRVLHTTLNFKPLVSVGKTFINTSRNTIDQFKKIDYTKMSKEQIEAKLQELNDFKEAAQNFTMLDEAYISQFGDENLSDDAKKTLLGLKAVAATAKARMKEILEIQKEAVANIAERENFVNENNKTSLFNAEREIGGIIKNFVEGSKLPAKLINFASNLIMRVKRMADMRFMDKFTEFKQVLQPLEREAASRGMKAFDLIGTKDENGLHLIKKVKKEFWEGVTEARKAKNKDFFKKNMDMNKFNALAKEAIDKATEEINLIEFSEDKEENEVIKRARIWRLQNSIDISRKDFYGFEDYTFNNIFRQAFNEQDHISDEYKGMSPAALKAWEFFTAMNERAKSVGYIDKQGMSFFPLVEATITDRLRQTNSPGKEMGDLFKELFIVKVNEEQKYGKRDVETGEVKKSIPRYFTNKGNTAVERLSTDLNKVGALWIKSLMDYEAKQSIENTLNTVLAVERTKGSLVIDEKGDLVPEGGGFMINKNINKNAEILGAIINDAIYDLQEDLGALGNVSLHKIGEKFGKTAEGKQNVELGLKKTFKNFDTLTRALAVGLKPLIGLSNYVGFHMHAIIKSGQMYTWGEFMKNHYAVTTGAGLTIEDKALFHHLTTAGDDVMTEARRKAAYDKGLISYLSTWSFTDVMMITNSFPEKKLSLTNAKSFNDNAIIINGKIVNARQYLREQDRKDKYKLSSSELKALENSFDDRVKALIDSSTKLTSAVRVTNEKITIEGVSEEEMVRYSLKVSEFVRNLNGQMNEDDRAGYRRDTIFSSFMMFKNWIPKLVMSRAGDLKYNAETDDWEYGRMRAMAKTMLHLGTINIFKARSIINGSPEGLQILRDMLESKKQAHFEKTGQELEITEEEFLDLMRRELSNEFKELSLLLTTMALVAFASFMKPPEDATLAEKNRYKLWAKAINKINEEMSFYYNPTSMEAITRGSILPSLGLLTKVGQVLHALEEETRGYVTDNDKLMDKTYPLKYFFNLIPGLAQFQNDYLPYIDPELAKAQGVRVTEEARR